MQRAAVWTSGALLVGCLVLTGLTGGALADQPTLNRITQVQPGMTMLQVLQTLGPPSDIVGHTFYYKMMGKVVFRSEGSPLDSTKVEKVEPSPTQNPVP
jgi:hypothetical protein